MEKVNLVKEIFSSKVQYQEVIDTSFTQLVTPTPELDLLANVPTIDEFFQDYEQLFFQIPKFGETNSHEYLILTSQAYVGSSQTNEEISLLQQEITSLRRQLLELQREPASIVSNILKDQGLELPQLTIPELPIPPTFESPAVNNAATIPSFDEFDVNQDGILSKKEARKKARDIKRKARQARKNA
jgi:polyhydroxyalkanoate synthesis regulator phasin